MLRQWLKMLLLVLALLSQLAMACPQYAGQQRSGSANPARATPSGGGY